jgi:hypothetical protein
LAVTSVHASSAALHAMHPSGPVAATVWRRRHKDTERFVDHALLVARRFVRIAKEAVEAIPRVDRRVIDLACVSRVCTRFRVLRRRIGVLGRRIGVLRRHVRRMGACIRVLIGVCTRLTRRPAVQA